MKRKTYTKNGLQLGYLLTIDGDDVIITGIHYEDVRYNKIHIFNGDGGFEICNEPFKEINHKELELIYDAYVSGLGVGALASKGVEKYINKVNPFETGSRLYNNWNYGVHDGRNLE
jgi:hypothetical protein